MSTQKNIMYRNFGPGIKDNTLQKQRFRSLPMTFGHGRKLLPVTVEKPRKVVYCTYPNDNNT